MPAFCPTLNELRNALAERRLGCRALVTTLLDRIEASDQAKVPLCAITSRCSGALERAEAWDRHGDAERERAATEWPLRGVPVVLKDNIQTRDAPTSAGSAAFVHETPQHEASVVRRLRAAGAIVLAKAHMSEFGFLGGVTLGTRLEGATKNPRDRSRTVGGSSGGTAAAVAAGLAPVGLGTDTSGSILGPAAYAGLVGVRPTPGRIPMDGIVPTSGDRDVCGPIARNVGDAARLLAVLSGSAGWTGPDLEPAEPRRLRVAAIVGVWGKDAPDPDVRTAWEAALGALRGAGMVIDAPVDVSGCYRPDLAWCPRFRVDLDRYLSGLGAHAPWASLEMLARSGRIHPTVTGRIERAVALGDAEMRRHCRRASRARAALRRALRGAMDHRRIDVLALPTWPSVAPPLDEALQRPDQEPPDVAAAAGMPAVTLPMGWAGHLPVGLTLLARPSMDRFLLQVALLCESVFGLPCHVADP